MTDRSRWMCACRGFLSVSPQCAPLVSVEPRSVTLRATLLESFAEIDIECLLSLTADCKSYLHEFTCSLSVCSFEQARVKHQCCHQALVQRSNAGMC